MEFDQYKNRLQEFTKKQDTEWEIYLDQFRVANPEPTLRVVVYRDVQKQVVVLGIKFWLALLSGIGALALSGFRVSERFFTVAGGLGANPLFSYGEAISAVLAVNVTIFALAIAYAYTTGKMSENSQWLGLGTAIFISAVAGLGQAFSGLGTEWVGFVSVFDLVLAFVLGIGATSLEYFSGDLLGVELVRYYVEKKQIEDKYRAELNKAKLDYLEQTRQAELEFSEQHKNWVRTAKSQFGIWKTNFAKWNQITEAERTQAPKSIRPRKEGSFADQVRSVLNDNYQNNQTVLSFAELSSGLAQFYAEQQGISEQNQEAFVREFVFKKKAQISELRTNWIKENTFVP